MRQSITTLLEPVYNDPSGNFVSFLWYKSNSFNKKKLKYNYQENLENYTLVKFAKEEGTPKFEFYRPNFFGVSTKSPT